jgi:hypothetical protein
MSFSPKVIQVLTKLIDQHLQGNVSDDTERQLLIKFRQDLTGYPGLGHHPLPLLYSRRQSKGL